MDLIILGAVGAIIWWISSQVQKARIAALEERIRLRDDQIADYRRRLGL